MHTINYINLFLAITVGWWSCQLVALSIMRVCGTVVKITAIWYDRLQNNLLYVNFRSLVMQSFRDINFP